MKKSCLNCAYAKVWEYPATQYDPADYGYDCLHENLNYDPGDPPAGIWYHEEAEFYAAKCPGYVFKDWDAINRDRDDALALQLQYERLPSVTLMIDAKRLSISLDRLRELPGLTEKEKRLKDLAARLQTVKDDHQWKVDPLGLMPLFSIPVEITIDVLDTIGGGMVALGQNMINLADRLR